jgi:hypothetical protein
MFLGSKARPPVSRLSRQCGILNISQPYRPPRSVTGIALLYGDAAENLFPNPRSDRNVRGNGLPDWPPCEYFTSVRPWVTVHRLLLCEEAIEMFPAVVSTLLLQYKIKWGSWQNNSNVQDTWENNSRMLYDVTRMTNRRSERYRVSQQNGLRIAWEVCICTVRSRYRLCGSVTATTVSMQLEVLYPEFVIHIT